MFRGRRRRTGTHNPPNRPPMCSAVIRTRRFPPHIAAALLLGILVLTSLAGAAQSWPRCITGCTANDVELIEVTAEIVGSCTPGGDVEAVLWASLHFNRNRSYCVRFVTDVYIDGALAVEDLVSEPFNVLSKGPYPNIYIGTVSLPCGSALSLENIKVMWSVNRKLNPVSKCQSGVCSDYGPGSKCTGDQFTSYAVTLPLNALDDEDTTDEETPVTTAVLSNDLLGLAPTSIISVTDGAHGSTTLNGDGTVTYLPDADFDGTDTYVYTIQDSTGGIDTATVAILVLPINDAPMANDDTATTDENDSVNIDVTANDVDPDGAIDPATVTIVSGPATGSIDVDPATGIVTYTPDPDTCGSDGFTYEVYDFDDAVSDEATVTIDIVCNEPPMADDDIANTDENTSVGINVISNDLDLDGTIDPSSVTITSEPADGELSVHPTTGTVTYTPDPGTCGLDGFRYTVNDDDGATSNEATVTIDVICDDPPIAIDDLYTVAEGAYLEVDAPGILANDVTSPWEPLSAVLVSNVSHGTLSLNSDGSFVYTHDGSETTSDSFTYYAFDGSEDSNIATVNIVVSPTNDGPTADDDSDTADEDTPVTIDVLANDTDPDGDPLSVDWVGSPSNGSVVNNGSDVTYVPDPDFHGVDTFTYGVTDGHGGSSTATVSVTVDAVNDPPIAQDDSEQTDEDTPVDIQVLDNDSDPDGDSLNIQSVTQPANGSSSDEGGYVTYTPDPEFHGVDTFTYTVSDGRGGTSTATVTVTVASVNDPPIARDDEADTDEDTPISIDVLVNDSDPDGDALVVQSVTQPAKGTVVNNGTDVTYTPDPDFHGVDTFQYNACDGNGCTTFATVTVTVNPVNDPPVAQDDTETTDEDVPVAIDVLDNDSDPDGDGLVIQSVTQPANGSVVNNGTDVVYTPDPNFHGSDTFTYTASDGNGGTDTATVTVIVDPVNDPPVAQDDTETTDEDTPVTIGVLDNDSDPDGDSLVVQSVTQPTNGSTVNNGTDVVYTPDPDFHGSDTFTYTVSDGNGGTDTATVIVTVDPVNDPPVAQDDTDTTDEDTPVTIDVLDNDSDSDGDSLIVQSVTQPANGSVANNGSNVVYTPDPGFNGSDTFTYTISDGNGGTDSATVTVSIGAVNDPPVAQDDSDTTDEDTPVTIGVLDNDSDPDGDSLVVQSVTQPANGIVVNNGSDIAYTPDPDFHGSDMFTYTISDGNGGADTATVTVTVDPVNDPPVAQDDSDTTDEDVPVTIAVLGNDSDPDGDALVVQSVTQPTNGSVVNHGTDVVYTPDPGFNGSDTFTYTISDGNGGTDTATVTITIGAVNDSPGAQDDSDATDEDTPVTIDVLGNDSDPDGDALVIQSVTQPANGSVTNNGSDVVYTPNPGFNGPDTFTYTISDGNGGIDTATATVSIGAVNDPPAAQDDSDATDEDTPVTIDVLDNDSDPDSDALVIQSVTQPGNGSVTNNGSDVVYTPNPGFNGTDTFTYTISDGNGGTDTATVMIAVAPVNDLPIAVDDTARTFEDTPVTIRVLPNDSDPDGDGLSVQSAAQPSHGTAVPSGASVIYTPNPGFNGADTFTYTISDGNGGTDTATVTITVDPVNDPPIAQNDSQTTPEDAPITVWVLGNDSDPEGDDLVVQSVAQPANGSVKNGGGSVTYTPNPGFSGVDSFTYTISDGRGGSDTATVTVTISAVNDPPIAQDDSASTEQEALVSILILENDTDPDGDFLVVESFAQPQNGTVLNTRTGVSYIPDDGFQGVDTFVYTVSDGNGGTDTATVSVSVAAVNAPPTAQDDADNTDEGTPITIAVLLNDSDPNGDALTVESVGRAENGTVTNLGGEIQYDPDPDFNGVDQFTYTISDGQGRTDTATVFIAVAGVNDAPIAQDDSSTTEQGRPIAILVLANDTDPDGDQLYIDTTSAPTGGSVTIDGGTIIYTPVEGYTGTDTFTYTISDRRGETDSATVTVGVLSGGAGGAAGDASCEGHVIISEIAWAGTSTDPRDEWIELRNLGTTPVDLTGWILRWRRTHPTTEAEQGWKTIELSGVLEGASIAACDKLASAAAPGVRFYQESPGSVAWIVSGEKSRREDGYYTIERRSDATISNLGADLVYDTTAALTLELSDYGDIVMLIDATGEVADTANASNLGRDGWAAGSKATFGTMERIDPLGPDTSKNWQTNMGIVIGGQDAKGRPLRATPGAVNSPVLERLEAYAGIVPSSLRIGQTPRVSFALTRQARKTTGWPWISVSRPGFAGQGGSIDLSRYSFAGRHESGNQYVLDIGTDNLAPGSYVFWIIYGEGEALLVPIIVTP